MHARSIPNSSLRLHEHSPTLHQSHQITAESMSRLYGLRGMLLLLQSVVRLSPGATKWWNIPILLQQLNEHAMLSMFRNATWTLSNFCRGIPRICFCFRLSIEEDNVCRGKQASHRHRRPLWRPPRRATTAKHNALRPSIFFTWTALSSSFFFSRSSWGCFKDLIDATGTTFRRDKFSVSVKKLSSGEAALIEETRRRQGRNILTFTFLESVDLCRSILGSVYLWSSILGSVDLCRSILGRSVPFYFWKCVCHSILESLYLCRSILASE